MTFVFLSELYKLQGKPPGTVTPDVALRFVHAANGSRHIVKVVYLLMNGRFSQCNVTTRRKRTGMCLRSRDKVHDG